MLSTWTVFQTQGFLLEVLRLREIAEQIDKFRLHEMKVKEKSVDRTSMTTPSVLPSASVPANMVQRQQRDTSRGSWGSVLVSANVCH